RVDHNASDRLCVVESEMMPRFAAIGGAPNAVADRGTLAVVGLAGSDVDNIRVGGRDADCADRFVGHVVELRLPVVAAVGGLPKAAGSEGDVDGHRILLGARNVVDATHHGGGADGAELEAAQQRVGGDVRFGSLGW